MCISTAVTFRLLWFVIEHFLKRQIIHKNFARHESAFKELFGPYGIRIINKAETDWQIKRSLSDVFIPGVHSLAKVVQQLEVIDTIFQAGLKPESDEYLLHDLKLKYGKYRLERTGNNQL